MAKKTRNIKRNKHDKIVRDYDVDNVSMKVLRIILSYYHFINRETWKLPQ